MNLSKLRGANRNFNILNWALQNVFWSCVASGMFFVAGKQPSSPGRAVWQPLPPFSCKKAEGGCSKDPGCPWWGISAVLGEKNCFREENPSRGASIMLPRGFRKQICEGFPSLFTVLRSSTGKFSNPRLSIHFLFFWISSLFRSFSFFFFRL